MILNYKNKTIFALSDTHGDHRWRIIPIGVDIIIHAGDICDGGNEEQIKDFFDWFAGLAIPHKIFVAGNHDLPFDLFPDEAVSLIPDNVVFLNNSGVHIDGINLYALEARPWLHQEVSIPASTDILITHGAPLGILDEGCGCPKLLRTIQYCKPKIHLFGHIHAEGGKHTVISETEFYNVTRGKRLNGRFNFSEAEIKEIVHRAKMRFPYTWAQLEKSEKSDMEKMKNAMSHNDVEPI